MTKPRIAVIGAGPAGSLAAFQLAQMGENVVLIDPCRPVDRRVESLPPNGQMLVRDLDALDAFQTAYLGTPNAMHIDWRERPENRAFGDQRPWFLNRTVLHAACRSKAIAAGVKLQIGKVTGPLRAGELDIATSDGPTTINADFVIDARGRGADGLRVQGPRQFAVPFRMAVAQTPEHMGTVAQADGWVWYAALSSGEWEGAYFTHAEALAGKDQAHRLTLVQHALSTISKGASPIVDRPVGADLQSASEAMPEMNVLRIGDAALARDPIGAHGLVHALRGALWAKSVVQTYRRSRENIGAAVAYMTERHATDCQTAYDTTARAISEQSKFRSAYWRRMAPRSPQSAPSVSNGVLVSHLTEAQVPHLTSHGFDWTDGVRMPKPSGGTQSAVRIGPYRATDVADALRVPGTLEQFATRLVRLGHQQAVMDVLDMLIASGALSEHVHELS